ncbi:DUF2971 domain-containing protein [Altererythrobacter soli]|uniref:DUF2971 domain-containing protein n=1 Tax=Croceibacterium soli TaxID=1739690 RepID=A0A6I4UZ70_9SPHN|nr:DUF2971 domain-containing protein [Croceibacterium soli]MXP42537.1 DUF2971 domain-containing protein [Croceibacterium soli]
MSEDNYDRIWKALHPETDRQVTRIRQDGTRFVHYTSAESAVAILRSGRMLLRNSSLLNDFSEVEHGRACLAHAQLNSSAGEKLNSLMCGVQADLPDLFAQTYSQIFSAMKSDTYLLSVSEHGDREHGDEFEDEFGRLSMWRAYANRNGVAFVFNNSPFVTESNALNAFTSPVVYATPESFEPHFAEVVDGLESCMDIVAPLGGAFLLELLIGAFRFATQSTKHPAFREEREWRIIYNPTMLRSDPPVWQQQLERVPEDIRTIGGVPQRVHAIPFKNYPDEGFVGATIPEILDRVLVGPSPDAHAIAQALIAELKSVGVFDAVDRVILTNIPLRT